LTRWIEIGSCRIIYNILRSFLILNEIGSHQIFKARINFFFILEDEGVKDDFSDALCALKSLMVVFTEIGNNRQSPDFGKVREGKSCISILAMLSLRCLLKYPEGNVK